MKPKELPSVDILREMFVYIDGVLYRAKNSGKFKNGTAVGFVANTGYLQVRVGKEKFLSHRVIWKMLTGEEPPELIDHINQNKMDNRIENLRKADHSINQLNKIVAGCSFHKKRGKWQSYVRIDGVLQWLGYHETEEQAKQSSCEFKSMQIKKKLSAINSANAYDV